MAITIPAIAVDKSQLAVQQVTTPDNALSEAAGTVDVNADIQMRKEQRDSDAFASQRTTELLLESQDLLNKVSLEEEDPNKITETFMTQYNDLYNSKLEGAPNELAKRVMAEKNNTLTASLGRAAIELQANEVQAKRLVGLEDTLNSVAVNVRNSGNYQLGQIALEEALAGAESYTTPSQLEKYRSSFEAETKAAYLDKLFETENMGAVKKLINDPEFSKGMTANQVDGYRKGIKSYQEKMAKMAIDNPIAVGVTPEQQAKNGVPTSQIRVLSNDQAKTIATNLNKATTPQELEATLAEIKATYPTYTDNALNELSAYGLKNDMRLSLTLMNADEPDQETIDSIFNMAKLQDPSGKVISPQNAAKDRLLANGSVEKIGEIETKALEGTKEWLAVNVSGKNNPSDIAFMQQKVKDLAAYYITQGFDAKQAATKASSWLTKGSVIQDINNHKFMLPDTFQEDNFYTTTARDILEDNISNLSLENIYYEDISTETGFTPEQYLDAIKSGGGWVNARDGKSLNLVDNNGLYVLDKTGRVITKNIDNLKNVLPTEKEVTEPRDSKAKLAIGVGLYEKYKKELK